jgi:hypothetical protein
VKDGPNKAKGKNENHQTFSQFACQQTRNTNQTTTLHNFIMMFVATATTLLMPLLLALAMGMKTTAAADQGDEITSCHFVMVMFSNDATNDCFEGWPLHHSVSVANPFLQGWQEMENPELILQEHDSDTEGNDVMCHGCQGNQVNCIQSCSTEESSDNGQHTKCLTLLSAKQAQHGSLQDKYVETVFQAGIDGGQDFKSMMTFLMNKHCKMENVDFEVRKRCPAATAELLEA